MLKEKHTSAENIASVYIAFIICVFPLLNGADGYGKATLFHLNVFYAATAATVLALLLCFVLSLIHRRGARLSDEVSVTGVEKLCFVLYLALCAVSMLCSEFGLDCWVGLGRYEGLRTTVFYISAYLIAAMLGRFDERYAVLFSLTLAVNTVIAALQLMGYDPLWLYPEGCDYYDAYIKYNGEFLGTVGNVDILTAYICIAVPFTSAVGLSTRSGAMRGVCVAGTLCGAALLVMSGTAAGVVAFTATVFVFLPYIAARLTGRRGRYKPERVRKNVFLAELALLSVCAVLFLAVPLDSGTLYEARELLFGRGEAEFGSGRLRIWRETWELIKERPLLGGGSDTLIERIEFSFERRSEELNAVIRARIDTAHNEPLNIWVNTGLLSLTAYAAGLAVTAVRAFRRGSSACAACGAAVFCWLVQSLFGFSVCIVSPVFWVMLGLTSAAASETEERDVTKTAENIREI